MDSGGDSLDRVFAEDRRFLWNVAYRLTGNAADADDVLQETFLRAMVHPPADTGRSWRPWLLRVALNLGRDLLRRRRRTGYPGAWLPSPVEDGALVWERADDAMHPGLRYDLVESASVAFLLALEVLTPMQRAVLLLRDVFDYSARDAAEALGVSETNARKLHSRARLALARYDASRRPLTAARQRQTQVALQRFLDHLAAGDVRGLESMLAADARAMSDGGGEFASSTVPVVGRSRVAALFLGLSRKPVASQRVQSLMVNGLPAIMVERSVPARVAPRYVLQVDVDDHGLVTDVYVVLGTRKLSAVPFGR
ncbi:sigma-70 family RNA polymerase sigma factor [Luteitalea sp. TBR-22]|uniref:sigma-70 family RNA polymerase sigma factor n=1 Tax=Luteitalea sp. TBR-22 TaxID=2802971 RepID=UPI001EF493BA|nr:sigma-70 family RNA polymerase sigma factor [Luteitalea sp. TBR-22]